LIRAEIYTGGEKIVRAKICGDFTLYPKGKLKELEKYLEGVKFEREEVKKILEDFMKEVEFPGVENGRPAYCYLRRLKPIYLYYHSFFSLFYLLNRMNLVD